MAGVKLADENVGEYSKVKHIEEDGVEDVYCCVVPNAGNFVANGIVVKNCDALRYALFTKWGNRFSIEELSREQKLQQAEQRKWNANPMQYPGFTNSHGWESI